MSADSPSRQRKSAWRWIEQAILLATPPLLGVLIVSWVIYGDRWIVGAAVLVAWLHLRIWVDILRRGSVDA